MKESFPQQFKQHFKCEIISSDLIIKTGKQTYFDCSTNFGKMTLIVEQIDCLCPSNNNQKECYQGQQISQQRNKVNQKQFYQKRNKLLSQHQICGYIPVIYEQYIITTNKNSQICLTLTQPVQPLDFQACKGKIHFQNEKKTIMLMSKLQTMKSNLCFPLDLQIAGSLVLLKSQLTGSIYLNFTKLAYNQTPHSEGTSDKNKQINSFLSQFCYRQVHEADKFQKLKGIIVIKDRLYRYSRQKLLSYNFTSWFQLAVSLNYMIELQIYIKVKQKNINGQVVQKMKKTQIKHLDSADKTAETVQLYCSQSEQSILQKFKFYDGYCTNLLQPVQYEQLLKSFFVDESTYTLKKDVYLYVERLADKNRPSRTSSYKGDIILIQPGVDKCQCINFFITYFKFIEPLLKHISFNPKENSLYFEFLGKFKLQRKLKLIFSYDYVIKDEQLSMIIQKSKLEQMALNISHMKITDSFLMFLANSQKMMKIIKLDMSYCQKITQNGVNSLIISPFCKQLQVLDVSGTPVIHSSLQSILAKTKLKQLYVNNCPKAQDHREQTFKLKNLSLVKLQALGMCIQPNFPITLQHLKIDIPMPIQNLRQLKDLPLKQLTLKLYQGKKNVISGIWGSLYGNHQQGNPVKVFVQGRVSKTLTKLDLSGSNVKLRHLKAMFTMSQLEELILEGFISNQQIDFSVGPTILNFSVQGSFISTRQLATLLKKIKMLSRLNISNTTSIKRDEVIYFLQQNKIPILTLVITYSQFSQKLIDPSAKINHCIENVEIIEAQTFFRDIRYYLTGQLIAKVMKSKKNVKFRQQQHEYQHYNKVINGKNFEDVAVKMLSRLILGAQGQCNNIFINDKPYVVAFQQYVQRKNMQQGINCQQFICVHKNSKKPLRLELNRKTFSKVSKLRIYPYQQKPKLMPAKDQPQKQVHYQSITHFTYLYRKTVMMNPDSYLDISLRGNRSIDCLNVMRMMTLYNTDKKIKCVDFRDATLIKPQIFMEILQIPYLQNFNHNQYQLHLDHLNFISLSQKYFKFFMKILHVRSLKVVCRKIGEVDILFSILFHILDYHYETIQQMDCEFQEIKMSRQNSSSFWVKLCQLKKLKGLSLKFNSCPTGFLKAIFQTNLIDRKLHLQTLKIKGLGHQCVPILTERNIVEHLALNLENSLVNQSGLLRIVRNLGERVRCLELNLRGCDDIRFPGKLFDGIGKCVGLQKLTVSFQYCPIKELSTMDFLQSLYPLKRLKQVEINLSFTLIPVAAISQILYKFCEKLPKCHFILYLIGGNKLKEVEQLDLQNLLQRGVQVIV